MRGMMAAAGVVMTALAGCGQSESKGDEAAAAANYRPPTVTSRLDFGGAIERRFHRLDRNGDDRLQADELPPRLRDAIKLHDKDGDGALSSEEWGAMMLGRFDEQDVNRDGNVTSEERRLYRERQRAAAPQRD